MILYYAAGSGLGHLSRAAAVIYTLDLGPEVLVASQVPRLPWRLPGIRHLPLPAGGTAPSWLLQQLRAHKVHTLYLDAFPGGLHGEWMNLATQLKGIEVILIARRLQWAAYRTAFPGEFPRFSAIFTVETISPAQLKFLSGPATSIQQLALQYPPATPPAALQAAIAALPRPHWLVVHAGHPHEVDALLAHAQDIAHLEEQTPSVILLCPHLFSHAYADLVQPHYPAWPLFPQVDRIFTACGFNSMQQTAAFAEKHVFIPFARRWDDQFWRAQTR